MSSSFPVNRVQDIIRRMDDNSSQSEAVKTCFGILAIMSRDEANKIVIARDGMETILNSMTAHVDKNDVQESGCDLLWSLAFNNTMVKEYIAKNSGASVLVRALKRHSRYADFLKSACGALSNMCQCKPNQEGVASQGGLQPLVGAIHAHHTNAKLLPFIFDALASLIVSNEDNARTVSSLGLIPLIISSLSRHKNAMDVVKSGCHTLAILTDVKGQASKIALAGGVPIILSLLDAHPSYADLHRVAAVVLLRMLQESTHVGREITCNEGVRVLLKSLEKGGAQQDTVAAVTHILFAVTNPSSPAQASIESQLWLPSKSSNAVGMLNTSALEKSMDGSKTAGTSGGQSDFLVSLGSTKSKHSSSGDTNSISGLSSPTLVMGGASTAGSGSSITALGGLVTMIGQYSERKDVVRTACRLLNNLGGYQGVVPALDKLNILDKVLECVSIHTETRDVVDSAAMLLKNINKNTSPTVRSPRVACVRGLLHVYRNKLHDEEAVAACAETLCRREQALINGERNRDLDEYRTSGNKIWEYEAIFHTIRVLEKIMGIDAGAAEAETAAAVAASCGAGAGLSGLKAPAATKKPQWSKHTPKVLSSLLNLIEAVVVTQKLAGDPLLTQDLMGALRPVSEIVPVKNLDIAKRIEKILPTLEPIVVITPPPCVEPDPRLGDRAFDSESEREDELAESDNTHGRRDMKSSSSKGKLFCESEGDSNGVGASNSAGGGGGEGAEGGATAGARGAPGGAGGYALPRALRGQRMSGTSSAQTCGKEEKAPATVGAGRSSRSGPSTVAPLVVEVVEGSGVTAVKRFYPQHPLKNVRKSGNEIPKLLDRWPNFLERLSAPTSAAAISRLYMSPTPTPGLGGNSDRMQLTYEGGSAAGRGVLSRMVTPVPYHVPAGGLGDPFEHSLTFDSEFESGNLHRVVQRGDANYDLFLRSDLHTAGHTQWFYFAVSNTHPAAVVRLAEQGVQVPPVRVRFNIVNLTKPDSLFNLGMRPVVYSCADATARGIGWVRAGSDITYYSNSFQRNNSAGEGVACYYTLSFTIEFTNPKDTVLIAYSYPYTFAEYKQHIAQILDQPDASDMVRQSKLCTTLGGEDCDLLVITNFADKSEREKIGPLLGPNPDGAMGGPSGVGGKDGNDLFGGRPRGREARNSAKLKPAIFISGRVHPGETPASWMMKGILEFLTSSSPQAQLLRSCFVIFVVPVLNPDGVIYGNNRCSLAGVDLNRQWKTPMKSVHPTVYYLKSLMMYQRRLRDVVMYVDLHGHSRKYNVFMYGCDDKKKPKPQVRAFPRFFSMHQVGQKYVSYADCSFHVKKGRESTARVVVARELSIPCSFTLEATFCGSNYGPLKHCHMNIGHLQEVGGALCDAMLNFCISEGQVKDAMSVPSNLKAVARIESAIAAENSDGVVRQGFQTPYGVLSQGGLESDYSDSCFVKSDKGFSYWGEAIGVAGGGVVDTGGGSVSAPNTAAGGQSGEYAPVGGEADRNRERDRDSSDGEESVAMNMGRDKAKGGRLVSDGAADDVDSGSDTGVEGSDDEQSVVMTSQTRRRRSDVEMLSVLEAKRQGSAGSSNSTMYMVPGGGAVGGGIVGVLSRSGSGFHNMATEDGPVNGGNQSSSTVGSNGHLTPVPPAGGATSNAFTKMGGVSLTLRNISTGALGPALRSSAFSPTGASANLNSTTGHSIIDEFGSSQSRGDDLIGRGSSGAGGGGGVATAQAGHGVSSSPLSSSAASTAATAAMRVGQRLLDGIAASGVAERRSAPDGLGEVFTKSLKKKKSLNKSHRRRSKNASKDDTDGFEKDYGDDGSVDVGPSAARHGSGGGGGGSGRASSGSSGSYFVVADGTARRSVTPTGTGGSLTIFGETRKEGNAGVSGADSKAVSLFKINSITADGIGHSAGSAGGGSQSLSGGLPKVHSAKK